MSIRLMNLQLLHGVRMKDLQTPEARTTVRYCMSRTTVQQYLEVYGHTKTLSSTQFRFRQGH